MTIIFGMIPQAILGVIPFFTGLELASTIKDIGSKKADVYVMLLTAGIALANIGVAFVAGVALYYAIRRRIVRI